MEDRKLRHVTREELRFLRRLRRQTRRFKRRNPNVFTKGNPR